MAPKEASTGLCHNCLHPFLYTKLYNTPIKSSARPSYSTGLCEKCVKAREQDPTDLETSQEFARRLNKYLGLK